MNSSYAVRLMAVSLASFFLVHLAAGAMTTVLAARAIRAANRTGAARSAWMLFALRVFPVVAAAMAVAGLCVPSYLLFEPEVAMEPVGGWCLLAAFAALGIAARPVWRTLHGIARNLQFSTACGRPEPVRVIESSRPVLALTGFFRPSIVISRGVLDALTPAQVEAALRHERAHHESWDNLKRLFLLAAPDLVPFAGGFGRLEREWAKLAEWAADDRATAGSSSEAVDLAEALVRVARLGGCASQGALASSLVEARSNLPARVDRLLAGPAAPVDPRARGILLLPFAILAASLLAAILDPRVLPAVHAILERLID